MTDIPENAKLARQRYEEGALTRELRVFGDVGHGVIESYWANLSGLILTSLSKRQR